MYAVNQDARHVALRRRTHALAVHAASHVNHGKGVTWLPISMYGCASVPLVAPLDGAPLLE